uniref:WW domain-containing protein n=1 Tax=Guillardia theta TaxID=55529 RepID=A0A6U6E8H9_GUITH
MSETPPPHEQPQLPGPHGTTVHLTFDRSHDRKKPQKFSISLMRSMAYYPDRLSNTPYQDRQGTFTPSPPSARDQRPEAWKSPQSRTSYERLLSQSTSRSAMLSPKFQYLETSPAKRSPREHANFSFERKLPSYRSDIPYQSSNSSHERDQNLILNDGDSLHDVHTRLVECNRKREKEAKAFRDRKYILEELVKSLRAEIEDYRNKINELQFELNSQKKQHTNDSVLVNAYEQKINEMQVLFHEERNQLMEQYNLAVQERDDMKMERDSLIQKNELVESKHRIDLEKIRLSLEDERRKRIDQEGEFKALVEENRELKEAFVKTESMRKENERLTHQIIELKMLVDSDDRAHVGKRATGAHESQGSSESRIADLQILEHEGIHHEVGSSGTASPQAKGSEQHDSNGKVEWKVQNSSPIYVSNNESQQHGGLIKALPIENDAILGKKFPVHIPKLKLPVNENDSKTLQPRASNSSTAGIGMSFHTDPASNRYIITDIHPAGPAGKALEDGLMMIGDTLIAVNGKNVQFQTPKQIVEEIKGPEGTNVTLKLSRSDSFGSPQKTFEIQLVRAKLHGGSNAAPAHDDKASATTESPHLDHAGDSSPGLKSSPAGSSGSNESLTLPEGWQKEVDHDTGKVFYVNHALRSFCWANPTSRKGEVRAEQVSR